MLSLREFRKAVRGNRLTCHEVGHGADRTFLGVWTTNCGRALVFGVAARSARSPLAGQIGFSDFEGREGGELPGAIVRTPRKPPRDLAPASPQRRVPVRWSEVRPVLEAAIVRQEVSSPSTARSAAERRHSFSVRMGNVANRLDLSGEELAVARRTVAALEAFWKDEDGRMARLLTGHRWEEPTFPAAAFDEPCVQEVLAGYLEEQGLVLAVSLEEHARCDEWIRTAEAAASRLQERRISTEAPEEPDKQ
jgi:hypothetical protein